MQCSVWVASYVYIYLINSDEMTIIIFIHIKVVLTQRNNRRARAVSIYEPMDSDRSGTKVNFSSQGTFGFHNYFQKPTQMYLICILHEFSWHSLVSLPIYQLPFVGCMKLYTCKNSLNHYSHFSHNSRLLFEKYETDF